MDLNRMHMKKNTFILLGMLLQLLLVSPFSYGGKTDKPLKQDGFTVYPFGSGGQLKMIYDRRQRPQAIYVGEKVYMVYNGGAPMDATEKEKTYPFVVSFDPKTRSLSKPVQLGREGGRDQHYCPVIWQDGRGFLHVLYGCHRTPGTHLISKKSADIGSSAADWVEGPQIRDSLSYPTVYDVHGNNQLVYFRTGEHRSSWSYLMSGDEGTTWMGPKNDVTDLNRGAEVGFAKSVVVKDEMSAYHTCFPSKDGKYLHVAFCSYDDNKTNIPEKFDNPRYGSKENFGFKYNLYYLKVNLQTHEVQNFAGETVQTPIDYKAALDKCLIWDTGWRGAGVPPDIILDENDNPAFLHVLSEDAPDKFNYYYVRYADGKWKQTAITASSDDWNSAYVRLDKNGVLHACVLVGHDAYRDGDGEMNSRGGGDIEEWISTDKGNTWKKGRDLTPSGPYAGWKFNNIQPVKDAGGSVVDGMLLFYGWKDPVAAKGKAFLLVDDAFSP